MGNYLKEVFYNNHHYKYMNFQTVSFLFLITLNTSD